MRLDLDKSICSFKLKIIQYAKYRILLKSHFFLLHRYIPWYFEESEICSFSAKTTIAKRAQHQINV